MLKDLYEAIRQDFPAEIVTFDGKAYIRNGSNLFPLKLEEPDTIKVTTLTGLVDYLKTNVDKHDLAGLLCHIENPTTVTILSNLRGDHSQRFSFIQAKADLPSMMFGSFVDSERFNVWVQSCFTENSPEEGQELKPTAKALILKFVGNVQCDAVQTVGDDGVSQRIQVKTGVANVENVVLPNPVELRPYRTFVEVEQPASKFVFRAKEGPHFALFEADGGTWKREAMRNIKRFMEFEVEGLNIIA